MIKKKTELIRKEKLKKPIQKLHTNFIMINFFLNRLQKIREEFRVALFDALYNLGYRSSVKIMDKQNNTISHISYYELSEDSWKRKEIEGEFSQIQTYFYECSRPIVRIKKSKNQFITTDLIQKMFKRGKK